MRVLVLDTATKTGFCCTVDGVVEKTGLLRLDVNVAEDLKGDFQRHPAIVLAAHVAFTDLVTEFGPDFIVAETPHLQGGSSFLTVAIYGIAQLVAAETGTGFYGVHTASWQSRIIPAPKLPKGEKHPKGATKIRSLAHVRDLGFDPETDDVADAICIAEYAHDELSFTGEKIAFVVPANIYMPGRAA